MRSSRADPPSKLDFAAENRQDDPEVDRVRGVLEARLGLGGITAAARIGRYRVLDRLANGAVGVVYRAYDETLDRLVALELVHAERDSPALRERLLREALAMSCVSSAHVVTVLETGAHEGRSFVARELVRGQTLRQWQQLERPRWAAIVNAYEQAARGLADAEAVGLVHTAFTQDSAMIDARGHVKVLDVGLAHRDHDLHIGQVGLCAALFEALYGEPPLVGDTAAEPARAVQSVVIVPGHREIPAWLRRVIVRGLAADSADRWPSMRALVEALAGDDQ